MAGLRKTAATQGFYLKTVPPQNTGRSTLNPLKVVTGVHLCEQLGSYQGPVPCLTSRFTGVW